MLLADEFIGVLLAGVSLVLLVVSVLFLLAEAFRIRRAGRSFAAACAALTAGFIGITVCVLGALGAGFTTFVALRSVNVDPKLSGMAQVLAALLGSWLVSRVYNLWLDQPVRCWFAEEGAQGHDR